MALSDHDGGAPLPAAPGSGPDPSPASPPPAGSGNAQSSSPPPPPPHHPADAAVETLLHSFVNQTVLVHIPDGRAFRGKFLCVDDGMNVILSDADELRAETSLVSGSPPYSLRWVGMVMIPGEHVLAVEVKDAGGAAAGQPGNAERDQQQRPATLATATPDAYDSMFL
ncbi:hypothetical protein OC842_004119 [Tilletia horrida]|uniref:Sm domain-containing protein n=1 Tax=Tilletia horrida TaxID=155126 RepID=A0AAN6JK70_9BASI|nr:hypothetical protein OC842_004119 [Tilletia horrida]